MELSLVLLEGIPPGNTFMGFQTTVFTIESQLEAFKR
jgi:hypothetical protein